MESLPFGERRRIGDACVSFHPAGHILGSAQIKVEVSGKSYVVSGDYKPDKDGTCEEFELVKCHGFVSECTFGLPVYRWTKEEEVFTQINQWWASNAEEGRPSVVFAYSLGKAQRVLSGLDTSNGPILMHPAAHSFLEPYRKAGISLPEAAKVDQAKTGEYAQAIIVAPPAVEESGWTRAFKGCRKSLASGWMTIRGQRRRQNLDRGFVLSDHADWNGLVGVISATEADEVLLTHGNGDALARYLCEKGIRAKVLEKPSGPQEEKEP